MGTELVYDLEETIFILLEGEYGIFKNSLTAEAVSKCKALLRFHEELRENCFDLHRGVQIAVASHLEERRFWTMMDDVVETLRKELDPNLYEIIEVGMPDPNPFVWREKSKART